MCIFNSNSTAIERYNQGILAKRWISSFVYSFSIRDCGGGCQRQCSGLVCVYISSNHTFKLLHSHCAAYSWSFSRKRWWNAEIERLVCDINFNWSSQHYERRSKPENHLLHHNGPRFFSIVISVACTSQKFPYATFETCKYIPFLGLMVIRLCFSTLRPTTLSNSNDPTSTASTTFISISANLRPIHA